MKFLMIVFTAALLVGCGDYEVKIIEHVEYRDVIPASKREEAAKWIMETVRAANPHSDEEPEDNIAQAQRTAEKIFGEPTIGIYTGSKGSYYWVFVPYEKCNERQKAMCDNWVKKGQVQP